METSARQSPSFQVLPRNEAAGRQANVKGALSTEKPSDYAFNTFWLFSRRFLLSGFWFSFLFRLWPGLLKRIVSVLWLHMLENTDSSLQLSYSENLGAFLFQLFPQAVFKADIIAYR